MKKKKILSAVLCCVLTLAMTAQPVFAATAKPAKSSSTAPVLTTQQAALRKQLNAQINAQAENARLENDIATAYGEAPTSSVSVKNVLQGKELPNGCEITALTMLINSEGINFTKDMIADFLPQKGFSKVNGQSVRAGGNPEKYYCGNPKQSADAYYCFEDAVITTVGNINKEYGISIKAKKLDSATEYELTAQIDAGHAVMLWGTLSMGEPVTFSPNGWVDLETGKFIEPYINLHTVVLTGYNSDYFFVSDPIKGDVAYKRATLMDAYEKMGKRAVVIESVM